MNYYCYLKHMKTFGKKRDCFHFSAFAQCSINSLNVNNCISYIMPAGRKNATHTNGANSNFQCIPAMKNYFVSESHFVCTCVVYIPLESLWRAIRCNCTMDDSPNQRRTTTKKNSKKNEIKI